MIITQRLELEDGDSLTSELSISRLSKTDHYKKSRQAGCSGLECMQKEMQEGQRAQGLNAEKGTTELCPTKSQMNLK
ncbi:hypothetical protein NC652_027096 [Populus alba x Populus x berolinensis]|nr:hypothetical protein NC652_027096 [Populus alba x Populus x berolinensis]